MKEETKKIFDDEYDQVNLEPFRKGKRKMMFACSAKDCSNKVDITQEYIMMEEQNNIRKKIPSYYPASEKLYIFTRYCEKHSKNEVQK